MAIPFISESSKASVIRTETGCRTVQVLKAGFTVSNSSSSILFRLTDFSTVFSASQACKKEKLNLHTAEAGD